MNSVLLILLVASLTVVVAEDFYIKSFLRRIAEEQCLSQSGVLLHDEFEAAQYDIFDHPVSTRYPQLTSELALILRNALGTSYTFYPDTPYTSPLNVYNAEEAVRMFKSCQAQDALYRIYNTQRFVSNTSIDDCVDNVYYIYYEDKLNENLSQVENLDGVGVLEGMTASDCAINVMNVFAKHSILKNRALEKSQQAYNSKVVIDLNEFREGTEWIELQRLINEFSKVECTEETSLRRSVCTIFN
jgi:hypothetical protein